VIREIVLDTETTGLDPAAGHRIVEIGAVELINHVPSGRTFHAYVNPKRDVPAEASAVHGLSTAFLREHPCFSAIVDDLEAFILADKLIIHNAQFDLGFLNAELIRLGRAALGPQRATCTLTLARQRHAMASNSLDALCKRYGVDNSQRDLHGALLDAEILADVYLLMTGGQTALSLGGNQDRSEGDAGGDIRRLPAGRAPLPVIRASDAELAAHQQKLAALDKSSGGACLWRKLEETADSAG
jgi:DNA polymerase-3 subunit epsilon